MAEWQKIETAPKDGTPILLWWRYCGDVPTVGRWFCDNDITEGLSEGWAGEDDSCIPINQHDCTHWQPLPPPPSEQEIGS
jgi:hypothetical protein